MSAKLIQLDKIKVGIVNYLNTRPLLYGLTHSPILDRIELVEDYPSNVARSLQERKIDMGLVPVAVIPSLREYHIIGHHCIGCNGPVASVCIFSEEPIENVKEVLLDYQSRTSVALARVLIEKYWKIKPRFTDTADDFRQAIRGSTAAVLIGDRALEQRHVSRYCYDLGDIWKTCTGLPFVFAAWVSNEQLPEDFIRAFDEANALGLEHIDTVVAANPYPVFDLHEYYTRYIDYRLDAEKRKGLDKFLSYLKDSVGIGAG